MTPIDPLSEDLREQKLDHLLSAYREATAYDSQTPDFMPGVWRRIESRRRNSFRIEQLARVFTAASVALAIVAGLFVSFQSHPADNDSWVEDLANDHLAHNASYYEPVHLSAAIDHTAVPSPAGPGVSDGK